MNKLLRKGDILLREADVLLLRGRMKLKEFLTEERGDTNFISIAIVLLIVIVLAGVFLTVGKNVVNTMQQKVNTFLQSIQ